MKKLYKSLCQLFWGMAAVMFLVASIAAVMELFGIRTTPNGAMSATIGIGILLGVAGIISGIAAESHATGI